MTVIIIAREPDREAWYQPIQALLPEIEILRWPAIGDPRAVDVAVVHKADPGILGQFPNLKALIGMWAGVEHILERRDLPDVPIARMVDPLIARDIGHYVVLHTLNHFRSMPLIPSQSTRPPVAAHRAAARGPNHRHHGTRHNRQGRSRHVNRPRIQRPRLDQNSAIEWWRYPHLLWSRSPRRISVDHPGLRLYPPTNPGNRGNHQRHHAGPTAGRRLFDQCGSRRPRCRGRSFGRPRFRPLGRGRTRCLSPRTAKREQPILGSPSGHHDTTQCYRSTA